MPQWRKLHLKTTESFDIQSMPDDFTRLVWVLLPLALDKEGRGIWNPGWVKAKLMPLRTDVHLEQMQGALDWYVEQDMVRVYEVAGRFYFHVPSWHDYQSTRKESESAYPSPEAATGSEQSEGGASAEQVRSKDGASTEQVGSKDGAGQALDIDEDEDKDKDVDEDKDEDKDKDKDKTSAVAVAFRAYEREIGPLTPAVRDQVLDAIDDERYPDHWIPEAISIAATANKRSWRYAAGILRNWHAEGYDGGQGNGRDSPGKNGKANGAIEDRLAEMAAATEDLDL